jgi:hypothetical protein
VVPVTGRSAGEVAVRLGAWGLPAGVAEYGAALVDGPSGRVRDLRSDAGRRAMAQVRRAALALAGVEVDAGYEHVVRAYRRTAGGDRTGLNDDDRHRIRAALDDPGALTVVPGESQDDLTPAECTKASGVTALLGHADLALAVGDGPADVELLQIADHGFLPRHARALARPGIQVTRGSYQAGLADAVAATIGHRPGGCPRCALELTPAVRFVLSALSMRAAGPAAIPRRLATIARQSRAVTAGRS